jgi:hypothetical protein
VGLLAISHLEDSDSFATSIWTKGQLRGANAGAILVALNIRFIAAAA